MMLPTARKMSAKKPTIKQKLLVLARVTSEHSLPRDVRRVYDELLAEIAQLTARCERQVNAESSACGGGSAPMTATTAAPAPARAPAPALANTTIAVRTVARTTPEMARKLPFNVAQQQPQPQPEKRMATKMTRSVAPVMRPSPVRSPRAGPSSKPVAPERVASPKRGGERVNAAASPESPRSPCACKPFLRRGSGAAASPALNRMRKSTASPPVKPTVNTVTTPSPSPSPSPSTAVSPVATKKLRVPVQRKCVAPVNHAAAASVGTTNRTSPAAKMGRTVQSKPLAKEQEQEQLQTKQEPKPKPEPKIAQEQEQKVVAEPEPEQKQKCFLEHENQQQHDPQEQEQQQQQEPENTQSGSVLQHQQDELATEASLQIRTARWMVDREIRDKDSNATTAAVTQTIHKVRTALMASAQKKNPATATATTTTNSFANINNNNINSNNCYEFTAVAPLLAACGLVEIRTPGTGNCQSMAIIEAATQRTFGRVGSPQHPGLELAVAALKNAECAAAMRDFERDHPTEFVTAQVYEVLTEEQVFTMDTSDEALCAALIKDSYTSIAASASDRNTILEPRLWGNSFTLAQATKVLGRPIYVLSEAYGKVSFLRVSEHKTITASTSTSTSSTSTSTTLSQSFLSFADWAAQYQADLEASIASGSNVSTSEDPTTTTTTTTRPLVVVLRNGNHYNAVLMKSARANTAKC